MEYFTKDEVSKMDEYEQIEGLILQEVYDALNGLAEIAGKESVEEYIVLQDDSEIEKLLGKKKIYVGLYGGINWLVEFWKDWQYIKDLENSDRILKKIKKGFRFENIDIELSVMANIVRSDGIVEIIKESKARTPDFRFSVNKNEWIYGEVTKRGNSVWDYATIRANELIDILKKKVIGKELTVAIKKPLSNEEFEKLKIWLDGELGDFGELEGIGLFYTNPHGIDASRISIEFIKTSFLCLSGGSFENENFIRIHAPYIDGGIYGVLGNKCSQFREDETNLLFIDVTKSLWAEWEHMIHQIFLDKKYSHISAVILLRKGNNIQTEVTIIKNYLALHRLDECSLKSICKTYKIIQS